MAISTRTKWLGIVISPVLPPPPCTLVQIDPAFVAYARSRQTIFRYVCYLPAASICDECWVELDQLMRWRGHQGTNNNPQPLGSGGYGHPGSPETPLYGFLSPLIKGWLTNPKAPTSDMFHPFLSGAQSFALFFHWGQTYSRSAAQK